MLWEDHKMKLLSGLLLLSLAGNCGLVSFMAGQRAAPAPARETAPPTSRADGPPGLAGLPPELRREAMEIMRGHRPQMQEAMQQVQAQRDAIRAIALRDTVDREKLDAAFAELRRRMMTAQEAGQAMMVDMFAILPLEQRAAIMSRQPRGPGRPPPERP
jgi:uncharacterized membrane protein